MVSAYLGYDEDFSYSQTVRIYSLHAVLVDLAFADGQSARRAYDRAVAAFTSESIGGESSGEAIHCCLVRVQSRSPMCSRYGILWAIGAALL